MERAVANRWQSVANGTAAGSNRRTVAYVATGCRSERMVGGRRLEPVRGLCTSPVDRAHRRAILFMLQYAVGIRSLLPSALGGIARE